MWARRSRRRVLVAVTGPDRSPRRMETVDGVFLAAPLLSPHGPSLTQPSRASSSPSAFLLLLLALSSLISAFLYILVFIPFLLFKCRKTDDC